MLVDRSHLTRELEGESKKLKNLITVKSKQLGSDAFKQPDREYHSVRFNEHPIVQAALHSAAIASLLFPTDADKAFAAATKLLLADVKLISGCGELSWEKYTELLSEEMANVDSLREVVREVGDRLFLPRDPQARDAVSESDIEPCRERAWSEAAELLLKGKTTLDFARLNKARHSKQEDILPVYNPATSQWCPLFTPTALSNNVTAVPLTSKVSVNELFEAFRLGCIKKERLDLCRFGLNHVIEFRAGEKCIALLELSDGGSDVTDGRETFEQERFWSLGYSPSPKAEQALAELKGLIRDGKVPLNKDRGDTRRKDFEAFYDGTLIERISGIPIEGRRDAMKAFREQIRRHVRARRPDGTEITLL